MNQTHVRKVQPAIYMPGPGTDKASTIVYYLVPPSNHAQAGFESTATDGSVGGEGAVAGGGGMLEGGGGTPEGGAMLVALVAAGLGAGASKVLINGPTDVGAAGTDAAAEGAWFTWGGAADADAVMGVGGTVDIGVASTGGRSWLDV